MATKKAPFKEMTRRRNVQGAIWRHVDGNGVPYYTVGITRSYKDRDENWQNETIYVPLDDIPRMVGVLQEAESAIYEQVQSDYEANKEQEAA